MTRTHYETLRISEKATQDDVKHAYRRLARQYHPDRNKKSGAEERFKEVSEAYEVLRDPGRRQIYDFDLSQARKSGTQSASPPNSSPPPPPPPHPKPSSGPTANASPSTQPQARGLYRHLYLLRRTVTGSIVAAVSFVLALGLHAACHREGTVEVDAAFPMQRPAIQLQHSTSAATASLPTAALPIPTPAIREATATPDPKSVPTLTRAPLPTLTSPPVHLCGSWKGSLEWRRMTVPFFMRLRQHGDEISGVWSETHERRIWWARVQGTVAGTDVVLVKRYEHSDVAATLLVTEHSTDLLRGTWEAEHEHGSWQARWESDSSDRRHEIWRRQPRPSKLKR